MSKFEWKFLAMPTNQSVEKKETTPVQMRESTNVATERTNLPTKIVRITAKTDVNARAMLKSQASHEVLATAELRELKENKEETTTDSKLEKTHTAIQKKEPLSELTETTRSQAAKFENAEVSSIDASAVETISTSKIEKTETAIQKNESLPELEETTSSSEKPTLRKFVESNEPTSQITEFDSTAETATLTVERFEFSFYFSKMSLIGNFLYAEKLKVYFLIQPENICLSGMPNLRNRVIRHILILFY